ncbi:hypothetical protein DASC09_026170 [Saccharomycopsis crataegensis]|uniref:MPN domain-containing protein n=1 Tax=Saccharomycopsis crataegensis TaxID=43959 RepID=A0AAV5QKH8_9ASCO|nr:hypothetical protein DASC09_026170 [Saccharomycopsis crataegensis]
MSEEILNLVRPNIATPIANASVSAFSVNPLTVKIQSPALLSILESSLRSEDNIRTIGALLGTRSDDGSELEIHDSYIIPHEEKDDEVTIDEHNHKSLFQLYRRSNPKNQIIGWFQTSNSLDTVTSLVHDFFNSADGTFPHAAVHLTLQSRDQDNNAIIPIVNTFVSTSVGSGNAESGSNSLFTQIPYEITYTSAESLALNQSMNSGEANLIDLHKSYNDLVQVEQNLAKVNKLLDANITYVEKILAGEIEVDGKVDKIGKFLISNLLLFSSNYEGFNSNFNNYIQDTLMIEYLVSSIKTQIELSAKLTTIV